MNNTEAFLKIISDSAEMHEVLEITQKALYTNYCDGCALKAKTDDNCLTCGIYSIINPINEVLITVNQLKEEQ